MTAPMDLPDWARPAAATAAETAGRLQALIDAIVDGCYDWDIGSGAMDCSRQFDKLLGLPSGGPPRTLEAWAALLHPEDHDRVMRLLADSVARRSHFRSEYRLRRADGSYVEVEDRACLVCDQQGRPTHLTGTVRDVTQERLVTRALRDSQELYETLFRKAADPALRVDHQGCIIDANRPALELLGLTTASLGFAQLADHMTPEEEATPVAADGGKRRRDRIQVRVNTPEGVRHLLVSTVPCRVGGQESHVLLGTDVTALKDLQEALEASRAELEQKAQALEDSNTALRVLADQCEADRRALDERVAANMRELVLPILERLRHSLASRPERAHVDTVTDTLLHITQTFGPFDQSGLPAGVGFTRREREIAGLVRSGKSTAEIAEALYLAPSTVSFHRRNIRRKLELHGRDVRLADRLAASPRRPAPAVMPPASTEA